jgi:hypothetical protein
LHLSLQGAANGCFQPFETNSKDQWREAMFHMQKP